MTVLLFDIHSIFLTLGNTDLIIYWKHGDLSALRELERNDYLDREIEVELQDGAIYYGDEARKYVEVLALGEQTELEAEPVVADD